MENYCNGKQLSGRRLQEVDIMTCVLQNRTDCQILQDLKLLDFIKYKSVKIVDYFKDIQKLKIIQDKIFIYRINFYIKCISFYKKSSWIDGEYDLKVFSTVNEIIQIANTKISIEK